MKTFVKITHSFLILFMLLFYTGVNGQSLITKSDWKTDDLKRNQLERFEKVKNLFGETALTKISIGHLGDYGSTSICIDELPFACHNPTFKAKTVEYVSEDDYTWYGELIPSDEIDGCMSGYILLMSKNGENFGEIRIDGSFYSIEDLGGQNVLAEYPEDNTSTGCQVIQAPKLDIDPKNIENIQEGAERACDVRVLVLFTPNADNAVGNIQNLIQSCIATTNQAFVNSAVHPNELKLVLAASEEIEIDETGETYGDILWDVRLSPIAQARRNFHDADIVVLMVRRPIMNHGGTAGIAFLGPSNAGAYAVSRTVGANDGFVFTHEVGHLFGCEHEPCDAHDPGGNCSNTGGFDHAHTWSFTTGWWFWKKTHERKTIMYSSGAGNSDVIHHFSNPFVEFEGRDTGIQNERHNSRTLEDNACTVAAFRSQTDNLNVQITGPTRMCPVIGFVSLNSSVSGAPGPYTYEWKVNTTCSNWAATPVWGTGSSISISTFDFPGLGIGDVICVRLLVTAPGGQTDIDYHYITIDDEGDNGFPCPKVSIDGGNDDYTKQALQSTEIQQIEKSKLYPNPTQNQTTLSYYIDEPIDVVLKIYDKNGLLVNELNKGFVESGWHKQSVDLQNYQGSLFYIVVERGGVKEEIPLIRVR